MIYNEQLSYNETYHQYDGVRIVNPESFFTSPFVGYPNLLGVILLSPTSIDSTLVFVNTHKILVTSTVEATDTTSYIDFSTLDYKSGLITYSVLDEQTFALAQTQTVLLGTEDTYIAFNVLDDQAHAISQAEAIILKQNSAGTVDVTIIPNT